MREIVNNRQKALQTPNWLPVRQAHRSVCHKHIDLFYPYVLQRSNQAPSLPTALAGITISLTVSQLAHLSSVSILLTLPLVSSAHRKRKTNSFPYKWSESLQPRDPVELQIFHLCLGASRYYSLAIIPSVSLFLFFFFLSLLCSHTHSPLQSTHAYADPVHLLLPTDLSNHPIYKKKKPTVFIALHPSKTQK